MCAKHAKMCDACKKDLIDKKLKQCATIFTNLGIDSTKEERRDAYAEEQQLLYIE